ncbi:MAG TPA: thioredoxin family protein [Bacteroidales bacterium]|nr:thioredoxin family protein [Bacteroidales bacterium]
MKSRFILLLLLVYVIASGNKELFSQEMKEEVFVQKSPFADQSTWVLGYFVRGQITRPPHSEWFKKGYDEYIINPEVLDRILKISFDGLSIKIILGTWCPDSRKQVPRFMKIIDAWRFPENAVTFIGVDDAKISPVGEYIQLGIERVPTFIFYKNNIEAGRIIENPLTSLEQDIVNILTGNEKN